MGGSVPKCSVAWSGEGGRGRELWSLQRKSDFFKIKIKIKTSKWAVAISLAGSFAELGGGGSVFNLVGNWAGRYFFLDHQ